MRRVIFTICLLCLFLIGCSSSPARKQGRLEFSQRDRYANPEFYDPYYPQSFTSMRIPRVKPMELPPEKPGQ
jgi:PBP1b-binding outer membrane lipoprotein LpoB